MLLLLQCLAELQELDAIKQEAMLLQKQLDEVHSMVHEAVYPAITPECREDERHCNTVLA